MSEQYQITLKERSYDVRVEEERSEGVFVVVVDGVSYEVKADREESSSNVSAAAPKRRRSTKRGGSGQIDAPMPGVVLELHVSEGDEVAEGATLITLESMKMASALVAPAAGVVTVIEVSVGDKVPAGAPLMTLEKGD